MKRWLIVSLYLAAAVVLFFYRTSIAVWLDADGSWAHHLLVMLAAFTIALVPAIPYGIVAALMGAKYGPVLGTVMNLTISIAAAAVLFLLVRYTFSPEQRRKAAGMRGVLRLTIFTERNPFMAVLFARLLPIVPAQVINIFAALTRMRFVPYLTATILGKIPFLIAVTLLGNEIFQTRQWAQIVLIVAGYAVFLLIVSLVYRGLQSRTRRSPNHP